MDGCTAAKHEALKTDSVAWASLKLIGYQRFDFGEGEPEESYEVRNCTCHSTLYLLIEGKRAA